ncbi:MAG: signal recognition particle protein, partial [Actinomycetales bacterium]
TTFAGKLAKYLRDQGNTPLLVAADLQRPNAVTQLSTLATSVNVPIFAPEPGNGTGDPVSVAKLAIEHAKNKLFNLVIIDTAGRLGVDSEQMNEAKRIKDVVKPDEVLFVVDSMIGQDAVNTAKAFEDGVGIDGVVLTKLDGDAKGGAALSIVETIKKPIIFTSTGEKLSDIDYFYPDRMASRILGLG